jgi:hypothetical protein
VLGPVRGVGVRVSGEEALGDEAGYSAKVGLKVAGQWRCSSLEDGVARSEAVKVS